MSAHQIFYIERFIKENTVKALVEKYREYRKSGRNEEAQYLIRKAHLRNKGS